MARWLAWPRLDRFEPAFLDHLGALRFTGEVRAVAEGTVLFADEPFLEVTAPLIEAQIVETALLNFIHVQTVLASKAARVVLAADGRSVAEFGMRRSHGIDAALKAARCAYLAGCDATSDVLAGSTYGIPLAGTMAHSYVTAFADELEAFRAYARAFPDDAILLLDTYDTLEGARKAAVVAGELAAQGHQLAGVRLDSGDLLRLSREVRRILDEAGFPAVRILVSGGLDEHDVERLLAAGAPIDAFGVGTRMNVSADAPSVDLVYKLVEYDGRDVLKLSEGKETWVGAKAIYRLHDEDVLALAEEPRAGGRRGVAAPAGDARRRAAAARIRRWRKRGRTASGSSPCCPTASASSIGRRCIRSGPAARCGRGRPPRWRRLGVVVDRLVGVLRKGTT